MKVYTFRYQHNYAHGVSVVIADTYEQAVEILRQNDPPNNENITRIYKTYDEIEKDVINNWRISILVFEDETEIDKPKLIYDFCEDC